MTDFDEIVLGRHDVLVLIAKEPLTQQQVDNLKAVVPGRLKGRIVVVESGFDIKVLRDGAA